MVAGCYHATIVDDALTKDAEISKCIDLYVVRLHTPGFRNLWTEFFVPICKDEYNNCPAHLLLIETTF